MTILFLILLLGGLDTLQLRTIFHEPHLAGLRPSFVSFSPDQETVYFTWNDSSKTKRHTYSVTLDGRNLQHHEEAPETRAVVSPDENHWVYTEDGNLWISGTRYDEPLLMLETEKSISNLHWLDDNRTLYFIKEGNVWLIRRDQAMLRQITSWDYEDRDHISIHILSVTGNGKYILLQEHDTSGYKEILFPQYVDTFVKDGSQRRGQAQTTLYLLETESRKRTSLYEGEWVISNHSISSSGRYAAIDRIDHSMKKREILRYDLHDIQVADSDDNCEESDSENCKSKKVVSTDTLFSKTTGGWVYPLLHMLEFAPDSDNLMFTSENDGWSHIYTVASDENQPVQRTFGSFEVPWVDWQSDRFLLFASTEADPGERRVYRLDLRDNSVRELTSESAFRDEFFLNRDRTRLIYEKSGWNQPADIYVMNVQSRRHSKQRITESVPERFHDINWQQPEYVRFTARDGETPLSMTILRPANFDPEKTYPAVVFVHGAGSLQNVYKGWSAFYPREYMFNQFLNQQGYVVIEVDYRHSTGYGRAFREDVTNWMGYHELRDMQDGLRYIDENGAYIDRDRVGIYGGSYGGFMALYAVSKAPDDFHAAAALRAVTNWENYFYANPWYTRARLGTPEENPENYKRSSPISYADTLSRPVILFHGLIDDNVGFQDAMQYVDRLITSGNTNFELMVYPSESHGFVSPDAWYDEYHRIFRFFEKHLK